LIHLTSDILLIGRGTIALGEMDVARDGVHFVVEVVMLDELIEGSWRGLGLRVVA